MVRAILGQINGISWNGNHYGPNFFNFDFFQFFNVLGDFLVFSHQDHIKNHPKSFERIELFKFFHIKLFLTNWGKFLDFLASTNEALTFYSKPWQS